MKFIHTKQIDGKWTLVGGDGTPFISKGICYVNHRGEPDRTKQSNPYRESVERLFDSPEAWASSTEAQLRELGFNTIGPWSSEDLFRGRMYSICVMNLARDDWEKGTVDDYFSPGFLEHADRIARETIHAKEYQKDPYLIGYCTGGEMRWGPDWRSPRSVVFDYLNKPAEAEGKQVVVQAFKELYEGDVNRFAKDWRASISSWEEALAFTGFAKRRKSAKRHEETVMFRIAEQYFRIARDVIKRYDPNHLLLGTRLLSVTTPKSVLLACKDYVDVLSVNHYKLMFGMDTFMPYMMGTIKTNNMLEAFHKLTEKPILITEFGYRVAAGGKKRYQPAGFPTFSSDNKRGQAAFGFIRKAAEAKHIVGWHLFQWCDQPPTGRFDGQDSNFGLVNVKHELHEDYARAVAAGNALKR